MVRKTRGLLVAAAFVGAMPAWAANAAVAGCGDGIGSGATSVAEVVTWPAALAPACREFAAKCEAGAATRGDLVALKKFIAASAVDGVVKTNLTREVRRIYQKSKKRKTK